MNRNFKLKLVSTKNLTITCDITDLEKETSYFCTVDKRTYDRYTNLLSTSSVESFRYDYRDMYDKHIPVKKLENMILRDMKTES